MTGLDLRLARRQLIASGSAPEIADELLAAAEAGMVAAYSEKDEADGGEN